MTSARPFVTITEQPAGKLQRFRYLSEVDGARSVGSIPGVNSTPDRKTYPAIHVHGHKGPFLVLLSLLNPVNNLVHPHAITGSDPRYQCRQGVIYVITDGPDVVFKNIGILCVKGKTENDVKMALKNRKRMNVDPFEAGFQHINDHRLIDFTAVRLCFQVFLPGPDWTPADLNNPQKYTRSLAPVASDVVYDAKKLNDLKITFINSCGGAGPVTGGHEMTLLCEKYTGQNPDVVFEDEHGWSQTASVELYHKQLAIVFRTPPYREDRDPNSAGGYKVNVYLQQSNERGVQRSQPATLYYLPNDQKGNPHKLPTTLQHEKPSISLKQVRIQQRPSPGNSSPEEARLKRWRPWGRSDAPPDTSATDSDVDHLHSQNDKLDKTASKHNDNDGRSHAIPLFDPEKSDLYTHEWIRKIEQLGAIHNWSDTVKSYYMQTRLSGIAKVWLSSLRNIDHMTWEEWTKKLLEAFPRKVDYAELIEEMLARRKIIPERSQYYYNKHALRSRLEMNAKKAYACLIEGVPLQMMTPALYDHYETHGYLHSDYHLDIEEPRMNARQIEPININITNHKYGTAVQEDRKIIHFNGADYSFGTNGQEDNRRVCCCCKEEKPHVIRHCSPSRQNEIRPSCIQRNQRRPVLEKSWHKPCSTLTSSSSSPSLGNPAPDWLTDENSGVPGNHSGGTNLVGIKAPGYPINKLSKIKGRGSFKQEKCDSFAMPSTSGQGQGQPFSPYQNIKMSPASYQMFSPAVENAELDYSAFKEPGGYNIPGSAQQLISDNVGQGNNIIPNMNTHNTLDPNMANVDLNINLPPTVPRVDNMHDPNFNVNNNNVHKFTARIPPGTKIKRSVLERPATGDSGELLPKREKMISPEFEQPRYRPSMSFNPNNPFNITNEPLPIPNSNLATTTGYITLREEDYMNANEPVLNNPPLDYNTSNCMAILDSLLANMDEQEIMNLDHSVIQIAESWKAQIPNLNNSIDQHFMHNIDQNLVGDRANDGDLASVSEELGKINL